MNFLDRIFRGSGKSSFLKQLNAFSAKKVGDHMTKEVHVVSPGESLIDAANIMIGEHISGLVVAEPGSEEPMGIITERDYIKQAPKQADDLKETSVGDLMTKELITVQPGLSLLDAGKIMEKHKFRKLVVTEGGSLAGIITQTDLVREMDSFYQGALFRTSDSLPVKSVAEEPVVLDVSDTVRDAHTVMLEEEKGSVLITEDEDLKGVFTEFDFLSQVALNPDGIYDLELGNVMSFPLVAVDGEIDVFDANHLMVEKDFRRLPVFEARNLSGKITQTCIRRVGMELLEKTLERAEKGDLDKVSFEILKEKPLVREVHGKIQKYRYPE